MWAYTKKEADWLNQKPRKPTWFKRTIRSMREKYRVNQESQRLQEILRKADPAMRKEILAAMARDF